MEVKKVAYMKKSLKGFEFEVNAHKRNLCYN